MRGRVLSFDAVQGNGVIQSDSGDRCTFDRLAWADPALQPVEGLTVDFVSDGGAAREILAIRQAGVASAMVLPSRTGSANDGTLVGALSLGAALLGLIPALGAIFLCAGLFLGIVARKQAKVVGNSTGLMLGACGIGIVCLVGVVQVLALLALGGVLFAVAH